MPISSGPRNQKAQSELEVKMLEKAIRKMIGILLENENFIDTDELNSLSANFHEHFSAKRMSMTLDHSRAVYHKYLEFSVPTLQRIKERLNGCLETFLRYNVPQGFHEDDSVTRFMSFWRDEAARGREKGFKSLDELLALLPKNSEGFDHVRDAEYKIGSRISFCFADYFLRVAASSGNQKEVHRKISKVIAAIERLRIEADRSTAIVDLFLLSARHTEAELKHGRFGKILRRRNSISDAAREGFPERKESDLVHLMLREVLRLEVAFSFPDLPTRVAEEVLVGMADHLVSVFEEKMVRVESVMREFGEALPMAEFGDRRELGFVVTDLYAGIVNVWQQLAPRMLLT